jgi:FkbH-like protein
MGALLAAVSDAEAADLEWRADARIHFLRNYTTEPVDPYLTFHLLRDDIRATISHGGYGTIGQELLDPAGSGIAEPPDIFVLSLLVEFVDPAVDDDEWTADLAMQELDAYIGTVLEHSSALVIANTFLPPIDALIAGTAAAFTDEIDRLNRHLVELQARKPDRIAICDWQDMPGLVDFRSTMDKRFWASSQAPFRAGFLDLYARSIAGFVRAIKGLSKKCLVLDCDNTLWGGVVGESGVEGIELHDSKEPGASFYRLQQEAIRLYERGVMLALCSKNNEEDVWNVLDTHPHALLKRSHLVAWRINWEDKASNIAALAQELNIGLDSMVFVDDSPRERALVADRLPEVSLVVLPDDAPPPPGLLRRDAWFEAVSTSAEDAGRTRMYQEQSARSEERTRFSDLSGYLRSLETRVRIDAVDERGVPRVSQLTQKTNQFNLTTRRYTEADIRAFLDDASSAVYRMTVGDRFGDMGVTGVFIARLEDTTATIDTLLLSCRILGRRIEVAFVDQCMRALEQRWPISEWRAEYIATRKNRQTAEFWDTLGFDVIEESDAGKRYASPADSRIVDYLEIMTVEME